MKIYSEFTKQKENLISHDRKKIKLYVCGITPYDTTHLGHAFTYTIFDVLVRYLTFQKYQVIYTQNVTDVDDDLLKRAQKENRDWKELGNFWTNRFLSDMKSLNILPPTHYVKATDSIPTIIEMVKVLINKKYAYENSGNIYFEVAKFPTYGKLSGYTREEMIELSRERGANPEDPLKKGPLDFILWQKSLPDEPWWDSPWGKGRPGWHIECSAMIMQYMGSHIDIHGGGFDLIYPHHESEIAQSEAYSGKSPFVSFWMHAGMLQYKGEKMSKSLGNLVLVSDLLKKYSANAIRFVLLSHHYRESWEFIESELIGAEKTLQKIHNAYLPKEENVQTDDKYMQEFRELMDDDLQTPQVLSLLTELADSILKSPKNKSALQSTLQKSFNTLGFT